MALGRAIVRQPQVFLFDEPLSNLDAKLRVQMRVELKKLHNRLDTTAIYVTHDQVEAMTLGDRVVVMKDGVVQQVGEPLELYNAPANRFVAGFIGSPAMNFAGVRLRDANGGLRADNAGFDIDIPAEIGARLRPYAGRDVTIGIRPEDFQVANGSRPARTVLRGRGRGGGAAGARRSCSTCRSASKPWWRRWSRRCAPSAATRSASRCAPSACTSSTRRRKRRSSGHSEVVGWVERSETHHLCGDCRSKTMFFTSFNPSYGLEPCNVPHF